MTALYLVTNLTIHLEVFSGGFSEVQLRDIDGGFPPDSHPYTEDYDYFSDSDLEDEPYCSGKDEEEPHEDNSGNLQQEVSNGPNTQNPETVTPNTLPPRPPSDKAIEVQNDTRFFRFPQDILPPRLNSITVLAVIPRGWAKSRLCAIWQL